VYNPLNLLLNVHGTEVTGDQDEEFGIGSSYDPLSINPMKTCEFKVLRFGILIDSKKVISLRNVRRSEGDLSPFLRFLDTVRKWENQ
jgi:hypothetical protein